MFAVGLAVLGTRNHLDGL